MKATQMFVSVWKENFVELQSYKAPDEWRERYQQRQVFEVGNRKSVKQCKLELKNMKASYHDAKVNNDKTKNERKFMKDLIDQQQIDDMRERDRDIIFF